MLNIIYIIANFYIINISVKQEEFRQVNLIIITRSMLYVLYAKHFYTPI
jgi:hypothetical protein